MKPAVVVFAPAYAPQIGGVERHLERVHRVLADRFELHVFARPAPGMAADDTVDGIRVLRPGEGTVDQLALAARHARLLRRAAAVHSHDVFPFALRRLLRRTRWVHTFHGYEGDPVPPEAIAARRRVRAAADYCFGVGSFIERWYGTPLDEVIWGAADPPARVDPAAPAEWDAIFYGRLEADTGIDAYLEGFRLVAADRPGARLLVVGDGSRADAARAFAADHGLAVEFRPATPEVLRLAARSRVAFVAGYLSIIECAQLRRPVVAYHGTAIKADYLRCHPMADELFLADAPAAIAAGFDAALDARPERLETIGAWADAQTWERLAARYAAAYAG